MHQPDPALTLPARLSLLPMALAICVLVFSAGTAVLAWVPSSIWSMVWPRDDATARMVPGIALALALVALAQVLTLRAEAAMSPDFSRRLRRASLIAAGLASGYAALGMGLWLGTGGDLPLFGLRAGNATSALDRLVMSLATAFCLLLAACGSLLRASASAWSDGLLRQRARVAATGGLLISLVAFCGQALGGARFDTVAFLAPMGVPTSLSLSGLFLGILLAPPVEGWVALLFRRDATGRSARRLVGLAVLLSVLMGLFLRIGQGHSLGQPNVLLALATVGLGAAAIALGMRLAAQRTETNRQVSAAEQTLRSILGGLDVAVFAFDDRGNLLHANASALALTAASPSPEHWLGKAQFHQLPDLEPLQDQDRPLARLIRSGVPGEMTLGHITPDRDERILHFSARRAEQARNGDETPGLWVLSVSDETQRWKTRAQLDRADRMDAIGQMSGGIAHEMGNILGVIRLSADTGLITRDSAAHTRYFGSIQVACDRGTELTERILQLSRSRGGAGDPVDTVPVLRSAVTFARRTVPTSVTLQTRLPREALLSTCDPADLENAVLNLVINAQNAITDAGQREGHILLSMEEHDGEIVINLDDDGPGMASSVLARAKDPFFTTRRHAGGTGLGLTMVNNFARRNQGSFQLISAQGRGTTARLTLPVAPSRRQSAEAGDRGPDLPGDLRGLRILVVEDDPLFGDILSDSLRFMGAKIDTATTGPEAVARITAGATYDGLIADIVLPGGIDGYEVATLARRHMPDLPVIYLSGYATPPVAAGTPPPGMHLRKPVSVPVLVRSIARLCRNPT